MKQIASWFKTTVTKLLDPERESRINMLVKGIQRGIQALGPQFTLEQSISLVDVSEQDLQAAKERVYRRALERAWSDGELNASEQKTAKWLSSRLKLVPEDARRFDFDEARKCFGVALAKAMEDGTLDANEENRLRTIAAAVGCELAAFMRMFFEGEGEAFLRSIFLGCVSDNDLSQADWDYLVHVTAQFGVPQHEMVRIIEPQARQFVEHVLADAKSDGRLTKQEKMKLTWMIEHFQLPSTFTHYVTAEIEELETLTNIHDGRLPSISMPSGMEHRSGEIVHWAGHATWREQKLRKDGVHSVDHIGVLAMTDNRLIFSSGIKSQTFGYRKIVAHREGYKCFEIQVEGKVASRFMLPRVDPIPYAIFSAAVAMANQTKLAKSEDGPSRHIPREVRQRVWQRYGGRCAECSAVEYLEFDHIIPVAKGGSNADANIQLLCRMCNLKKSDLI